MIRISENSKTMRVLFNIGLNEQRYDVVMQKLSSGREITKAHDNPSVTQRIMFFKNIKQENEQYLRNVNDAKVYLEISETALYNTQNLLNRVKELATQAGNGALNNESRQAIVQELNQIINEIVNIANINFNNKFIFAGNKTANKPYDLIGNPPTGFNYNGDTNKIIFQITANSYLDINVIGSNVFNSILNNLIQLRDNVANNNVNNISNFDLTNIDNDMNNVLKYITEIGAKTQILEYTNQRLTEHLSKVEELIANTEGIDIVKTIALANSQESIYKTSLSVISKMQKLSLADYL